MANILDYLDWRGDLSFDAAPFNEVDNYILTKIGTPDLTGYVPGDSAEVPLPDALDAFCADHPDDEAGMGPLASKSIMPMLRRLPRTRRFASLRLTGFVNRVDFDAAEQFSALTLRLPGGLSYISFRGTDDTIIAWKENFHMAIMDEVPAQRDAAEYLLRAAADCSGPLIVGGHSKGGNLAVYAAANAPEAIQQRILTVYNNDGPGFQDAFLRSPGYLRIREKIYTILSQNSIVGTLLTQDEAPVVVESSAAGIAAHDGFTWQVLGDRFLRCPGLSRASLAFDGALGETLDAMDTAQRRRFIDELFDGLMSTGAVTLTDITEAGVRNALDIFRALRRGSEVHKFALQFMELMLKELRENRKE